MVAKIGTFSRLAVDLRDDFKLLGRLRKGTKYRTKQRIDFDFLKLMQKYGYTTGEYGYALGSYQTSFNAIKKYKTKNPPYDLDTFARARWMLAQSYAVVAPARLVADYFEWLELSTSPGYPWNLIYRNKREALKDHKILLYCAKRVEEAQYPHGIWQNTCKTEPKKWKKIEQHESRVITAAPIEVQCEAIYLFADMDENIHEAGRQFRICSTVGTSHFYLGFHDLYRRMVRSGRNPLGLALDYTGFDGSVTRAEFEMVRDLRFSMYRSELQTEALYKRLVNYYNEMIYTRIIMETGDVIQKEGGQPSGQLNTLTDNSMINEFRWYYIWCSLVPDEHKDLKSFRSFCELIVCGDDSLISVAQQAQAWLRPQLISEISTRMGWFFKFETAEYTPIHKLTYCSKYFVWYHGYVVSAPSNVFKQMASVLYGSKAKKDVAREKLARALGIRQEAYFLPKFRALIEEHICVLFDKYDFELRRKATQDMPEYEDLLSMKRDWYMVIQLYVGFLGVDDRKWHPALRGNVPEFTNDHVKDLV